MAKLCFTIVKISTLKYIMWYLHTSTIEIWTLSMHGCDNFLLFSPLILHVRVRSKQAWLKESLFSICKEWSIVYSCKGLI